MRVVKRAIRKWQESWDGRILYRKERQASWRRGRQPRRQRTEAAITNLGRSSKAAAANWLTKFRARFATRGGTTTKNARCSMLARAQRSIFRARSHSR